jgi:hypothetical protein
MAYMINREAPQSGLANLLALRGRQGDTELVHMSKPEIAALQSMGQMTVNPATGLPEAFKLKDILPTLATIGVGMATGGLSIPAQMAVAGGTSLLVNKGDMGKAAMDALMAYGGAKLGSMLGGADVAGKAGAEAAGQAAGQATGQATGQAVGAGAGLTGNAAGAGLELGISGLPQSAQAAGYSLGAPGGLQGLNTASMAGDLGKSTASMAGELGKSVASAPAPYVPSPISRIVGELGGPKQLIPKSIEQSLAGVPGAVLEPGSKEALISAGISQAAPLAAYGTGMMDVPKTPEEDLGQRMEVAKGRTETKTALKPQYSEEDIKDAFIQDSSGVPINPLKFFEYSSTPAQFRMVPRNQGGSMGMEDATRYHGPGMASGMVRGSENGDGMSDDLLFQVKGGGEIDKAALSKDEYIVDAFTVAALGNGSSDAGAKILDEFREEIRRKAYGNKKQPKQIEVDFEIARV